MADNAENQKNTWIWVGIIAMALIGRGCNDTDNKSPGVESTEEKLRRVYDSQGIDYDEQMIREDARAIERLSNEFPQ